LQIWCEDVNDAQNELRYLPLYIKQELWEKHQRNLRTFGSIVQLFGI
jgi:hypothetical protein